MIKHAHMHVTHFVTLLHFENTSAVLLRLHCCLLCTPLLVSEGSDRCVCMCSLFSLKPCCWDIAAQLNQSLRMKFNHMDCCLSTRLEL